MELKLKRPIVFFDLETTGVDISRDRIVEISMAKVMPDGELIVRTRRINPTVPIPKEATAIHHITDEDVKDCPTFRQIAKSLKEFLEGCDFGGFNSNRFDLPLLAEEFLRAGVDINLKNRRYIDVQNIFHKKEERTLSAAYRFYCDNSKTMWSSCRNTPRAAKRPTLQDVLPTTTRVKRYSHSESTRGSRWPRYSSASQATTTG